MTHPLITSTELARKLGVRSYQIVYAHQQGHLPEPPRVAGKRVYGPDAVEQIRHYAELHGLAGRRRGRPGSSTTSPHKEGRTC
jgi:hypothetical protein